MQLHAARLCLDCQEIHDTQMCPMCGSESFAYITRWVPAPYALPERRPVKAVPPTPQVVDAYRELLGRPRAAPSRARWLTRGLVGLAAMGAAAWAWQGKPAAPPRNSQGAPKEDDTSPRP